MQIWEPRKDKPLIFQKKEKIRRQLGIKGDKNKGWEIG